MASRQDGVTQLYDLPQGGEPERLPQPEKAQNFESYPCALCGEPVAAPWIRFQEGQMRCLDCAAPYRRLDL